MTVNCFILIWKGFITNTKKQGKKWKISIIMIIIPYSTPPGTPILHYSLSPWSQANKQTNIWSCIATKKKLAQPTSPSRGISASGSSPIFIPHRSVLLDVLSCVKSPQKPLLIGGQSAKMELSCGDNPPQTPWKEARHQLVIMREGGGGCTPEMWPGN